MKLFRATFIATLELGVLLATLLFVSENFTYLKLYASGTGATAVIFFWVIIFIIDSGFYLALRFILGRKQRTFLQNLLIAVLVALLLGIAAFAVVSSTGHGERVGILFLLPLILLALRHLFLKFLATRK